MTTTATATATITATSAQLKLLPPGQGNELLLRWCELLTHKREVCARASQKATLVVVVVGIAAAAAVTVMSSMNSTN